MLATLSVMLPQTLHAEDKPGFAALSGDSVKTSPLFGGVFGGDPDFSTFLNALFKASLAIGAILAVLRIVYGGFLYMTKDTFSDKNNAKQILSDAVIGLLLLLAIWLILNQINPHILDLKLNMQSVQTQDGAAQNYNPGPDSSSAY